MPDHLGAVLQRIYSTDALVYYSILFKPGEKAQCKSEGAVTIN